MFILCWLKVTGSWLNVKSDDVKHIPKHRYIDKSKSKIQSFASKRLLLTTKLHNNFALRVAQNHFPESYMQTHDQIISTYYIIFQYVSD